MSREHIVVVGASLAGLRTVQALRRRGSDARITLIGDEPALPYDRPLLSKGILLGTVDEQTLQLVDAPGLAALDVEPMLGTAASGLDLNRREVAVGSEVVPFDKLVVATGSRARRLPGLKDMTGVHVLRRAADAAAIRAGFERGARVAVVGGGFIGAEVAAAARHLELSVAVVDPLPVLMQRGLGEVIGTRMTQVHADHGVRLRLGRSVARALGTNAVEGLELDDGSTLPADLVVIGVGAEPNTGWLESSGLALDDGVVCDEFLRAAHGIYAVGDVARWRHPGYGRPVRAEHWTAAGEHAQAVAKSLTGSPTAASSVPYIWTDQYGQRLQVAGQVRSSDAVRFDVDEAGQFVALSKDRSGVLQAVFALGRPAQLARHRMAITPKLAAASFDAMISTVGG